MICISDKIINIAKDLGFVVNDYSLSNGLKFLVKKNIVSILGTDIVDDDAIDLVPLGKGFKINFADGKSIYITNEDYRLKMYSEDKNVEIIRTENDDYIGSVCEYNDGKNNLSDYYHITDNSLSYSRNVDGYLDLRVNADSIGAIKSGQAMYQLKKIYPVDENESLFKRIAMVVYSDDIVCIDEGVKGLTYNNYVDLSNALNEKFEINKRNAKTRVLDK